MKFHSKITIPEPFIFNLMKHHLGYLKDRLQGISSPDGFNILLEDLNVIGSSVSDLYIGSLNPLEIVDYIHQHLIRNSISTQSYFADWLKLFNGFAFISLPDNSKWILRYGNEQNRYIHLHPGKYSEHTLRVKASSLKTALCVLAYLRITAGVKLEASLINQLRTKYLKDPPIKYLDNNSGVGRVISILSG
ncbi:MAG: hypothetical protein JW995_02655 [Melioribacteraceae bacterium]|nr:hypothetical protein [Melioribacteraceae bacterium]